MTGGNLSAGKGDTVSFFSFHSLAPSLLNRAIPSGPEGIGRGTRGSEDLTCLLILLALHSLSPAEGTVDSSFKIPQLDSSGCQSPEAEAATYPCGCPALQPPVLQRSTSQGLTLSSQAGLKWEGSHVTSVCTISSSSMETCHSSCVLP